MYHGNDKIKDTGSYGVFAGNRPIDRIYKGSEKVYQYQPYAPDTVVVAVTQGESITITLPKGIYKISMVGNAGYTHSHYYYVWTYYHGGTGSFVEIEYKSDGITPITLSSNTSQGGVTTLSKGGNIIVTAGGGNSGGVIYNGDSNPNIIEQDSSILSTITDITGYSGSTDTNKESPWAYGFASGYLSAGASYAGNPVDRITGAFRVQYLRREV